MNEPEGGGANGSLAAGGCVYAAGGGGVGLAGAGW